MRRNFIDVAHSEGVRGRRLAATLAFLAFLAGLAWLFAPGTLAAHANLASSEPAQNSELEEAPARVIIWFTEPIEPALSSIRVLDASGKQVDHGNSVVDDLNPLVMSVGLGEVPDGTYTVAWKNVSTVDGHRVRGSFIFAVGQPLSGVAAEEVEQPLLQSPLAPFLRWLMFLSGLAMVGGLVMELLVTRPALMGAKVFESTRVAGTTLTSRTMSLTWAALAVFLVASAGQLLLVTTITHEVSFWQAFGEPVKDTLAGTEWGEQWVWRMAAAIGFGLALFGLRWAPQRWGPAVRLLALALGCAALWAIALTSHGAATVDIRNMALAADFLHLLASAFWVGAIFHFALGVPALNSLPDEDRREALADLVPRFSVIAALSVAVIVVTGVFSAWAQVTVAEALATPYGATLIAKAALVLPLLLLGAINLLWVRPRLRRDPDSSGWLKRLLIGEAMIGVLIIAAVGMLTSLEPARQVASRELAEERQSVSFSDVVEGDSLALEVSPGRIGANDLRVFLTDRLGRPITNAHEVVVRLVFLESDLGDDVLTATSQGNGIYTVEDAQLSIAGIWQAELTVRRPDAFDARTAFRFEVFSTVSSGSAAISPSPATAYLLLGGGLLVLGLLFLGAGLPLGGWFSRSGAGVMTPGVAGVAVGLLLLFNAQLGIGGTDALANPHPPTPDSLEAGEATYTQVCQACHGVGGKGDGPGGVALEPPPADLTIHVPLHGDADLFRFIRDGIPGTGMVPLSGRLTDDQIWHTVNYIRTLEE